MGNKIRQTYYENLKVMGFPDLIAASIAAQAVEPKVNSKKRDMQSTIYAFQDWPKTKEGSDFWICFKNSLP
jgi:hypothetical protein